MAHVLVVHVEIHEAAHRSVPIEQMLAHAFMASHQIGHRLADVASHDLDGRRAADVRTNGGRDEHANRHQEAPSGTTRSSRKRSRSSVRTQEVKLAGFPWRTERITVENHGNACARSVADGAAG